MFIVVKSMRGAAAKPDDRKPFSLGLQEIRRCDMKAPAVDEPHREWTLTSLLREIESSNPRKVRTLLKAGVDRNGFAIDDMIRHAAHFLHFDGGTIEAGKEGTH
jgi:hypothetical protein